MLKISLDASVSDGVESKRSHSMLLFPMIDGKREHIAGTMINEHGPFL
ncbi:hypothetical protein [Olivibacter sitiensis]|nr:hypothetical protein [Olivibacter sitiensis]